MEDLENPYIRYWVPCGFVLMLIFFWIVRFLKRAGILKKVHIEEVVTEPCLFVYRCYKRDYRHSFAGIKDVVDELSEAGIKSALTFGIYYDDPHVVPSDECRSILGVILDKEEDADLIPEDSTLIVNGLEGGEAYRVEWPYSPPWSIISGVKWVYPKLYGELRKVDGSGPAMEVYNEANGLMWFYAPVDTEQVLYVEGPKEELKEEEEESDQ